MPPPAIRPRIARDSDTPPARVVESQEVDAVGSRPPRVLSRSGVRPHATTTLGTIPYQANPDLGDDADPNPDSRAATIRYPLPSSTPYKASSPTVARPIGIAERAVDAHRPSDTPTLQEDRPTLPEGARSPPQAGPRRLPLLVPRPASAFESESGTVVVETLALGYWILVNISVVPVGVTEGCTRSVTERTQA